MSFAESKKQQKDFLEKINGLNARINPVRGKHNDHKKEMQEVVNNAALLYRIRDYIISVFWEFETKKLKKTKDKLNLHAGVEKLRQLKNEYDNEGKKFKEDHNIRKERHCKIL